MTFYQAASLLAVASTFVGIHPIFFLLLGYTQGDVLGVFTYAIAVRLGLVIVLLLHEWTHLLVATVFARNLKLVIAQNLRANVAIQDWLAALWPHSPLSAKLVPFIDLKEQSKGDTCSKRSVRDDTIRLSGWLLSLAVCLCSSCSLAAPGPGVLQSGDLWTDVARRGFNAGCWLCLAGATVTDLFGTLGWFEVKPGKYYCGNFGLLVGGAARRALDCIYVLEQMAAVSTQRGGQSGGLVTLVGGRTGDLTGVRVRVCPSKRQVLSRMLASKFKSALFWNRLWSRLLSLLFFWRSQTPTEAEDAQVFLGHTRFATSSIPSVQETHPHQWTPTQQVVIWRVTDQGLVCTNESHGVFVTHNGDFDFWNLFGRDRTHSEIGPWLQRVLDAPQPAHCDSVMVAGLMEFLRTQGLWLESLRLAYHQTAVMSFEEVFSFAHPSDPAAPNTAPGRATFQLLSTVAEDVFSAFVKRLPQMEAAPEGTSQSFLLRQTIGEAGVHDLVEALAEALGSKGSALLQQKAKKGQQDLLVDMPGSLLKSFAQAAVTNWLDNDLFWALKWFLANAKGSFGLVVCCTLDPTRAVLAALNQPLSLGFAPDQHAVLFSSEAQSLKTPLLQPGGHKELASLKQTVTETLPRIKYRLDLDEADGEVIEVLLTPSSSSKAARKGLYRSSSLSPSRQPLSPHQSELPNGSHSRGGVHNWGVGSEGGLGGESLISLVPEDAFVNLRLHNLKLDRAVAQDEFMEAHRLVEMLSNPYINFEPPVLDSDLVGHDIKDTPRVLTAIRAEWESERSPNRLAAQALFDMLAEKAAAVQSAGNDDGSGRKEIDVLITGVESSLWVGEQFASDLQNFFPQLRVVPISANKVIGVLGNARGAISTAGFSFCKITSTLKKTIVIAISQSGQTFPTLHATRILHKQCPGRVFVLVGSIDSKMAAAVGQSVASDAPCARRVFWSCAGWRAAEPATVSCIAAHQTLTELMLFLGQQLRVAGPLLGSKPLGLRLSRTDISDMERIRDVFIHRSVGTITGSTTSGEAVHSSVHSDLLKQGKLWGSHITEAPVAWALSALYIFGTVISGYPLCTLVIRLSDPGGTLGTALLYAAHTLDALSYCFLPLIFSTLLRILERRPLLARLGKRTLVIGDIPYVHQLLEIYVSKLFALSYSIASIDVHGTNPIDHFVHRFTHRVARGVLLAIGRPDGRLCTQTKCESWVLMGMLQAKTIINLGEGAETFTIGHNPYVNPVVMNTSVVLPSNRPSFLCEKLLGVEEIEPLKRQASVQHAVRASNGLNKFQHLDGHVVGEHYLTEGTVQKARRMGLSMLAHGTGEIEEREAENPLNRDIILSAMEVDVKKLLDSQSPMEELLENRFLSLERYIAFLVVFHAMARHVSRLWPLTFDTSRSQSCLRIATTAAPVSASDLEREWLESVHDAEEGSIHARRGSDEPRPMRRAFSKHQMSTSTSSLTRLADALTSKLVKRTPSSQHLEDHSWRGGKISPGRSLNGAGHPRRLSYGDVGRPTTDIGSSYHGEVGRSLAIEIGGSLRGSRVDASPGSSVRGGVAAAIGLLPTPGGSVRGGRFLALPSVGESGLSFDNILEEPAPIGHRDPSEARTRGGASFQPLLRKAQGNSDSSAALGL